MFELKTKRLRFRNYTDSDFYFLKGLLQSKDMMRYIGNGEPRSEEEVHDFFSWIYTHYKEAEHTGLKVIENRKVGEPIGHAGIVPQVIDGKRYYEIGYWIATAYWGQGYATEAAAALLQYAKDECALNELIAIIQPANIASKKVAESIGMHFDRAQKWHGIDVEIYRISFE